MVDALREANTASQSERRETLLTPRFYTTDFEALAKLDISAMEADFEALLAEFQADYNREHFQRDAGFVEQAHQIDPQWRALMLEFLERSCTSEFSGFLLYKEISRRLKAANPLLAECFKAMSRDEARHAGFLNKAMGDYDLGLDLSNLAKQKKYTFFKPKFIFYATYLSEKIGYWRYIAIFRHLERHPENRIHPLFNYFKNWCQDENRHGDFFGLILKSQPQLLKGPINRLWVRFFLLSFCLTMYLNDRKPHNLYSALGLDASHYAMEVLRQTNLDSGKVFPLILDLDNPRFQRHLDRCADLNLQLEALSGKSPLARLPVIAALAGTIAQLFLLKPVAPPAPEMVR
ncbi:magnesium-protoporphyrin IX monomethyl ester (oxidative) cyclase [Gloeobacter violaceus]|uniref:Magnesium-protoporphyrin IX monomethyl ester [oxidative] cyclase n=1 Tax=Gloeobacter violaceus (strain ATCC 29082 / PCC 7421) TaxID=251221 RepID=ACSF_GLOVI|nr:magnesium-protoporphyrin IX monomethyl ester (oxidative) cyclase [Gloeobacter violaceus]Q7NFA1.1 RecName: Full=Magnesium-protoporphyrin IX monomethyl ester [oxidative] cyclase; Short=Mg-protoporphyrin IX monomethyl ester oxidative cyclase [Gloeobacter violaceus PCC 7421]BAC91566.1 ycf59 [Gloeobacter violaceus PCC 7421]